MVLTLAKFPIFYTKILHILAFIIFLSVGFFLSIVSEGFCLVRFLPQSSSTLETTILVMNLVLMLTYKFPSP
jgi:hypothetical protein